MAVKLSLEQEENPKKAVIAALKILVLALLMVSVGGVVFFTLSHFLKYGINDMSVDIIENFLIEVSKNPLFLLDAYANWGRVFMSGLEQGQLSLALFVPALAPLTALLILILAYVKSSYSFSLWYMMNNHFAKLEDVRKMGVLNGIMLVFGRFQEHLLGVTHSVAVLCFGEIGSGKTSSVAIPSILRSDNASLIAVENNGALASYTSGYRATLGPVFYFNWDVQDNPDKGCFYPRWNPLANSNLPPLGEKRDGYLAFIAAYFADYDMKKDKDNYWKGLVYTSINTALHFMVSKVRQAKANDYFLNQLLEKGHLNKEDKDILLSYYISMPDKYVSVAMQKLKEDKLTFDDYCPIGSWEGIATIWQGKDICLPMLADWLLQNYLTNSSTRNGPDAGKALLETLILEAFLFNYNKNVVNGIQQLFYLSRKQRQIVFPMIMKPMFAFRNECVRERTCGNDFNLGQLRGIRNQQTKNWEPITIYAIAGNKSTKFVNGLLIEMMMSKVMSDYHFKGPFPVTMVIDDVGQMPKIRGLAEAVAKGPYFKMSTLLLCNSLQNVERVYGTEGLEDLVTNTNYKLVLADDNQKLSRQLNKLALFATKSVQIPAKGAGVFFKAKAGWADANYYHHLSKWFTSRRNMSVNIRGYQLLLVAGYYHLPILAKSIFFLKDDKFKDKAIMETQYFLNDDIVEYRVLQDINVPALKDALSETDLNIEDEADLDKFMNIVYDEAINRVRDFVDKTSVLIEDISNKWQKSKAAKKEVKTGRENADDWWLEENSFDDKRPRVVTNPFVKP